MSLVARHLEANGIPTVVLGSARDVVEHCGVARFLFVDFPLGNPCGKPYEPQMQAAIVRQALSLFELATAARTTVQSPYTWSTDEAWRNAFSRVDDSNRAALLAKGEARRLQQQQDKSSGATQARMIAE